MKKLHKGFFIDFVEININIKLMQIA